MKLKLARMEKKPQKLTQGKTSKQRNRIKINKGEYNAWGDEKESTNN